MTKAKSSKRKHKPKFYRREEKPLGKRCKFYSREACDLEDCDSCIIKDAYEQGKKDGDKQGYSRGFKDRKIDDDKLIKVVRTNERKQTLEEVLKDIHRRFELAKKYHNRRALSDLGFEALEREHGYQTEWLEQTIKETG